MLGPRSARCLCASDLAFDPWPPACPLAIQGWRNTGPKPLPPLSLPPPPQTDKAGRVRCDPAHLYMGTLTVDAAQRAQPTAGTNPNLSHPVLTGHACHGNPTPPITTVQVSLAGFPHPTNRRCHPQRNPHLLAHPALFPCASSNILENSLLPKLPQEERSSACEAPHSPSPWTRVPCTKAIELESVCHVTSIC